jgi:hypothetical protein
MKPKERIQEPTFKNQIPKRKAQIPIAKTNLGIWFLEFGASVLLVLGTGVGCVTLPSLKDEPATKPAANPAAVKQELQAPPVTPDEITEDNVHEKVEALRKELSREDK